MSSLLLDCGYLMTDFWYVLLVVPHTNLLEDHPRQTQMNLLMGHGSHNVLSVVAELAEVLLPTLLALQALPWKLDLEASLEVDGLILGRHLLLQS